MLRRVDQVYNDIIFEESTDAVVEIRNEAGIQSLFGLITIETLVHSDCLFRNGAWLFRLWMIKLRIDRPAWKVDKNLLAVLLPADDSTYEFGCVPVLGLKQTA